MKNFFRQNGILLLVIALLLSVLIGVSSALLGGNSDPLSNVVNTVTAPVRGGVSAVLGWAEGVYEYVFHYGELHQELDELRLHGMTEAHARFSDYLRLGHEGDYWYGAAEFQTMVNCAVAGNLSGMTDANAAAGVLMYHPELAQSRLEDVCAILETCMAQPDNTAQWEASMSELRHLLEEGAL